MFQNNYDKFVEISVFQNACCMFVLQIGELCKVVSKELREREVNIPWREWCGIRDIFAHQYSNLDYQSAWGTSLLNNKERDSLCLILHQIPIL